HFTDRPDSAVGGLVVLGVAGADALLDQRKLLPWRAVRLEVLEDRAVHGVERRLEQLGVGAPGERLLAGARVRPEEDDEELFRDHFWRLVSILPARGVVEGPNVRQGVAEVFPDEAGQPVSELLGRGDPGWRPHDASSAESAPAATAAASA